MIFYKNSCVSYNRRCPCERVSQVSVCFEEEVYKGKPRLNTNVDDIDMTKSTRFLDICLFVCLFICLLGYIQSDIIRVAVSRLCGLFLQNLLMITLELFLFFAVTKS